MSELLVADEITKVVGWVKKEKIVDHVSLRLNEGEITGLLGPNGAGKTTTMKMLLGLTSISTGKAEIFGAPVPTAASRAGVGFLPEAIQHPDHLSVYEYVRFHARLSAIENETARIEEHLRQVEMWEYRDRLLNACSKGMRQRTDIARILLRQARLIFLDEPFSGLDPCGQVMLKELLMTLKKQNISILVNSHAAGILADVCDTVCVMNRGRIVINDRLEKLLKTSQTKVVAAFADKTAVTGFISGRTALKSRLIEPAMVEFIVEDSAVLNELTRAVIAAGGNLLELTPIMLTLDQLFVKTLGDRPPAPEGGQK